MINSGNIMANEYVIALLYNSCGLLLIEIRIILIPKARKIPIPMKPSTDTLDLLDDGTMLSPVILVPMLPNGCQSLGFIIFIMMSCITNIAMIPDVYESILSVSLLSIL